MHVQTHQDQLFFEAVYAALAAIIHEALGSFKTRQEIDVEVCVHLTLFQSSSCYMQKLACTLSLQDAFVFLVSRKLGGYGHDFVS